MWVKQGVKYVLCSVYTTQLAVCISIKIRQGFIRVRYFKHFRHSFSRINTPLSLREKHRLLAICTILRKEATSVLFLCGSSFLVKLEFEMLVFVQGRKWENPEKNPWSKARTQPTHGTRADWNLGHIGGRWALSSRHHPCHNCVHWEAIIVYNNLIDHWLITHTHNSMLPTFCSLLDGVM